MTRRGLLLLAAAVALGPLVGCWLLTPRTAIMRWNAARIEIGMTPAEVEAILGGPARQEGGPYLMTMRAPDMLWETPDLAVCVWFDGAGRVRSVRVYHDDGPPEFLRRWLRL